MPPALQAGSFEMTFRGFHTVYQLPTRFVFPCILATIQSQMPVLPLKIFHILACTASLH
jgi:hypothetical protein